MKNNFNIGHGERLTLTSLNEALDKGARVALSPEAIAHIKVSHAFLQKRIKARDIIYGVNTQFGDQGNIKEPLLKEKASEQAYDEAITQRQHRVVRSLACGVGPEVDPKIVKLTMMLRAHCLAQGFSGVSVKLLNTLLEWVNSDIVPVVYQYGSIGASGDLIPLAHIAAAVVGEPVPIRYQGKKILAQDLPDVQPYVLSGREGLALINGTSFMTAITTVALQRCVQVFEVMLRVVGMQLEALGAQAEAYHPTVHLLKHHPGAMAVAEIISPFLQHTPTDVTVFVQDCYSLRAVAQGFGPFWERLQSSVMTVEREINSVNDNPIVDAQAERILHGANFMGYSITQVCDGLKADIAQAATWLHALLANLFHPRKNRGLPINLVEGAAHHNGFRGLQILAAALAVETRKLAQSHAAFMLPTEGDNQDVNSLGTHAAFDFEASVTHLERICAVSYLAAAQAWEFRNQNEMSQQSQYLYDYLRDHVPAYTEDHSLHDEIEQVVTLIKKMKIPR